MIAAMVNIVSHRNRETELSGFDVGGLLNCANGSSRTSQKRLESVQALFLTSRLMMNSGLSLSMLKYLWSHPSAGIAINTSAIDVKISRHILGASLLKIRHRLKPKLLASVLGTLLLSTLLDSV